MKAKEAKSTWKLNPLARRWLAGDPGFEAGEEVPEWDLWLLQRLAADAVISVGQVLVDRRVLEQRFACVPDRCAPGHRERGTASCCADVQLGPTRAECRRLARRGPALEEYLKAREPRLHDAGKGFWLEADEVSVSRPGGRCAFSEIDRQGRIRCRLHAFARQVGAPREEVQPLACRLFPLILVDRGAGRAALTVLAPETYRLVSSHRPQRYPCLRDPALPYLTESMGADLDWLFGKGFARELGRRRKALES